MRATDEQSGVAPLCLRCLATLNPCHSYRWPECLVFEGETSTMTLQPSLHGLQVLMRLEENDSELDLGPAQLLQQRRRRMRAPRRFWVRPWILRRADFGHNGRLMHEEEVEDREAFINFLTVPSELLKQDTWFSEVLKPRLKLVIIFYCIYKDRNGVWPQVFFHRTYYEPSYSLLCMLYGLLRTTS